MGLKNIIIKIKAIVKRSETQREIKLSIEERKSMKEALKILEELAKLKN